MGPPCHASLPVRSPDKGRRSPPRITASPPPWPPETEPISLLTNTCKCLSDRSMMLKQAEMYQVITLR